MRMAAVVLAAGKSERMGANKLLLEVAGRTIIDRLLYALDDSMVDDVFVVLGHRPEALRPHVEAHRAEVVLNPHYEKGMTSSFKAGLRKVLAEATFLVLGDQLGLEVDLLEVMAATMASDPDSLIVSPVYKNRRGHPVLFRRTLFPEILNLGVDETLMDVIHRHEGAHRLVEGNLWCTIDIDTPEEFERIKELFEASRDAWPQ